jgi:3-dehydroquinate synthase
VAEIDVPLAGRPYKVIVGSGARQRLPELLQRHPKAAVLADRNVSPPPLGAPTLRIRGGEQAKTMRGLEQVLKFMERSRLARDGALVVVGGGSIGDLGGLAASVWQRGIACYHVPTTLLAMIDSSLGGKTGVNTQSAKNAIGTFWQPKAVVADLDYLETLPEDEFRAAFGEVVKYGVAMDAALSRLLQRDCEKLLARDLAALEPVVMHCVKAKAGLVAEDERDQGRRALLNYGHTVGHGIEAASDFRAFHGRAVAAGMRAAALISMWSGTCSPTLVRQQDELLSAFGLPGRLPKVDAAKVLAAMRRDKKVKKGEIEWVLPVEMGRAETQRRADHWFVRRAVREVLAA